MRNGKMKIPGRVLAGIMACALAAALTAVAQYPGQVAKPAQETPTLRSVAVLEWTGDLSKPKSSRLIPVCIYDGKDLQDAGVYMARPAPMALDSEVEYQILENGRPVGRFVVNRAGRQQETWVGFGKWRPLAKPKPAAAQTAKIDIDDADSDVPVLHRKHSEGTQGGDSGSKPGAPPPDPDRPTLHKGGDSGGSGTATGEAPDEDRPTMKRGSSRTSAEDTGSKAKKKKGDDTAYVEDVATVSDPERPHLVRGKLDEFSEPELPSLIGLPVDLEQAVAVSDAKDRPVHEWDYTWANPEDADKMKTDMEELARAALGLTPPQEPAAKPVSKNAARKPAKPVTPPPAAEPAPLLDEQFRIFGLSYGSGATIVLTARASDDKAGQKYVALVAQPDLYGKVSVLLKNVTDTAHLDVTPYWRLVDAVDALADNRGELMFEMRGATQRQFALYRVLRGQVSRIFASGLEPIGVAAGK